MTDNPQAETTLVEGPQTVSHNANQPAVGHSPRATEAELYVLLRKAGEGRYDAQALIDRHRDEVLRRQQPVDRAAILREAADICDEAGAVYTSKALNDHAGAAFALMERFLRKADEAEYVATPCSLPNVCEDGGEPCSTHERLMAHAEGDHELCGPDCGTSPSRTAGDGLAATTCSAQYHGHGETRLCIRAAQHTGKAHADEHGFHWSDTVAVYPLAAGQFRTGINVRAELQSMVDEAQQPETQADGRAAIIAELLPAWEAVYEPGTVSDYLIGYANDEAPAKAAAEAWMRSQAEVTGRLEWVPDEQLATGRYDRWFELVERHDDGIDTGPGLIVRRRTEKPTT